jgi:predicted nucleic acid-binding Zn ribbon protein
VVVRNRHSKARYEKTCIICGATFKAPHPDRKICSDKCNGILAQLRHSNICWFCRKANPLFCLWVREFKLPPGAVLTGKNRRILKCPDFIPDDDVVYYFTERGGDNEPQTKASINESFN